MTRSQELLEQLCEIGHKLDVAHDPAAMRALLRARREITTELNNEGAPRELQVHNPDGNPVQRRSPRSQSGLCQGSKSAASASVATVLRMPDAFRS